MRTNHIWRGSTMLLAALLMGLFFVGTSQAQADLPVYVGKFTLTGPIHWNKSVLQSGDYTITIGSTNIPVFALIRDSHGRPVARVMTGIRSENVGVEKSVLFLKEKNRQLCVYSLALADLRTTLIYDPVLARKAVLESQVSQTVPVMWAKK